MDQRHTKQMNKERWKNTQTRKAKQKRRMFTSAVEDLPDHSGGEDPAPQKVSYLAADWYNDRHHQVGQG